MSARVSAKQNAHAPLASVPFLERLRPPTGWHADRAVLSTYSADPAVVVAALLALAGQDDDSGTGSRIGLAKALTRLRDRVHIIAQAGRLTLPRRPAPILALLDRFLVPISWNEGDQGLYRGRSWHPKFALVRQRSDAGEVRWVFVLGSRNLTRDTAWDLCLALDSGVDPVLHAQTIPGIAALAQQLGDFSPLLRAWSDQQRELSRVRWSVPAGLTIDEIRLMLPDEPNRQLPSAPAEINRLLAVSPFLDGAAVAQLSSWCEHTQLLSTRPSLQALSVQTGHPLQDWTELLTLPEPDYQSESELPADPSADPAREAMEHRGLHAKFLFVEHRGGPTLWLGSPNLTTRAWTRNAEMFARVRVNDLTSTAARSLTGGLEFFVDSANTVKIKELDAADAPDPAEEELDRARRQVSARLSVGRQGLIGLTVRVVCDPPPHPDSQDFELLIGRINESPIAWSRGASSSDLSPPASPDSIDSDLLHIVLCRGPLTAEWLQAVPWNPPLTLERDDRALRHYLGARQTLLWIRETLTDVPTGVDGGAWDGSRQQRRESYRTGREDRELPSIESFLRIWVRNPDGLGLERLKEVDRILSLPASPSGTGDDPAERDASTHLERFRQTWTALRKGLTRTVRDGR